MYYVFHGDNTEESARKKTDLIAKILEKMPQAHIENLEATILSEAVIDSICGQVGLFETRSIYIVEEAIINDKILKVIVGKINELAGSENVFIFFERSTLLKKVLDPLLEKSKKIYLSKFNTKAVKKDGINLFSLADMLGRRSRRDLWVGFIKALEGGVGPEEIHAIMLWQIKTIIISGSASNATVAGLSPFVYSKSKKFINNWTDRQLQAFHDSLVASYHDSRRGICDLGLSIERMILSLDQDIKK